MSFPSVTISRFIGIDKTRDELSLEPGQLTYNKNFLYEAAGSLKKRGGGAKLSNPPNYSTTPATSIVFPLIDAYGNGDGELTGGELGGWLTAELIKPEPNLNAIAEYFDAMDTDDDDIQDLFTGNDIVTYWDDVANGGNGNGTIDSSEWATAAASTIAGYSVTEIPGTTVYGASNYRNSSGSEFLIIAQGTDLYYYNSGWQTFGLTLTENQKTRFTSAGYDTDVANDLALYSVNGNDNVVKIYNNSGTPTAKKVTVANGNLYDSPTDGKYIITHKNRLFIASDDLLYYSDVLDFDAIDAANAFIPIFPGVDGFIKGIAVWGDALFIFKEFGIYVLPNADDATPGNWQILRTNAATGTQSPDSITRTKAGIFYFSTDNKVRYISPNISYSSGEYTLGGSETPVISHNIEADIDNLLDKTNKDDICAVEFKDLYIVGFKSINNSNNYNDVTFFADTTKWNQIPNIPQPQPYWGEFDGFNYNWFAKQTSSGEVKLYGFKGENGECHETLNESIDNDNSSAIDAYAILGWLPINGEAVEGILEKIVFIGQTEGWDIDLTVNGYSFDKQIPENGDGISKTFTVNTSATVGVVGTAEVGTSLVGSLESSSSRYRVRLKGNYFRIEFRNNTADEFVRVNKVIFYYKDIRSK